MRIQNFINECIDFLFPPHHDVVEARAVSPDALHALFSLRYDEALSVYTGLPYSEAPVRSLIRANKYYADTHSARILGEMLFEMLVSILEEKMLENAWHRPLLAVMPPSPRRLRERGHNQVARIVERMPASDSWERADILRRHHRESQTRVPRSDRKKNIAGAFYVAANTTIYGSVRGRSIILIDDVCESGSTMKDAARALREAGARAVIGVALAQ